MSADVVSDILNRLRLTGAVFYWVDGTDPWIAASPPARDVAAAVMPHVDHMMMFHVVVEGECWASLADGTSERLGRGDIVVFPQGDAHVLQSSLDMPWRAPVAVDSDLPLPIRLRCGSEGEPTAIVVCGFLGCDAYPFNPLLQSLPRLLRIRPSQGPLEQLIALAVAETQIPKPGGAALRARLAEMMFVAVVRDYLAGLAAGEGGWLGGLRDPHVGRALALLHGQPARAWNLEDLAREVGSSRAVLHERFRTFVGMAPMQYLTNWRMQLAASMLGAGNQKVVTIAMEVGYDSEAAFNRAFKRAAGMPPASWRRAKARHGAR